MGDGVPRTEQVGDLIVAVAHDRLLERNDVGPEPAQAVGQEGPALVPRAIVRSREALVSARTQLVNHIPEERSNPSVIACPSSRR